MNSKNPILTAIRFSSKCSKNFLSALVVVLGLLGATGLEAGEPLVKKNARVAVVGDSITEAMGYSRMIETYLTVCQPQLETEVFQFGWSGERVGGLIERMDSNLALFDPTIVTLCYGMNDGSYRPYDPSIGKTYEDGLRKIVGKLKEQGKQVVLGGPGAVDPDFFKRDADKVTPDQYNTNLETLSGIAKTIAGENGIPHAEVHDSMMKAIPGAKAAYGKKYHVCGPDGYHPLNNGHLIMTYAFLKAMGFDGDLGTITLDFNGTSGATGGHVLKSFADGSATVESTRYPYCFKGPAESPNSTSGILPFVPFNEELNRLTLVVKNAPSEKLKVTWGNESRVYTKQQLEKGVNLAADFIDNPFVPQFEKMERAVSEKQAYERSMVKEVLRTLGTLRQELSTDAEATGAIELLSKKMPLPREKKIRAVREAFKPVVHTVKVEKAEQG